MTSHLTATHQNFCVLLTTLAASGVVTHPSMAWSQELPPETSSFEALTPGQQAHLSLLGERIELALEEEREDERTLSSRERGLLLHSVLEAFFDDWQAAGEGAEIEAALGAKSGIPGEAPLRGTYLVEKLGDGQFTGTGPMFKGLRYQLGPMALLRTGGVRVIVSSKRAQAADQSILRHLGLEAAEQKIIALKSSVHFRADFSDLASEILIVESPGLNTADTMKLHYKHLRPGLRVAPLGPTIDERP